MPGSVSSNTCCAGSSLDCVLPPSPPVEVPSTGSGVVCAQDGKRSIYSSCGKLGKVAYTVGAVFAAFEFYNSVTKAGELTKRLQRLRDASGEYQNLSLQSALFLFDRFVEVRRCC